MTLARAAAFLVAVAGAAAAAAPERARACAACSLGDPTLAAFGTERPYEDRLRFTFEGRYREDAVGEARVDRVALEELRAELGAAWAPADDLFLQLALPVLFRHLREVNLAETSLLATGDLELRARWQLTRGLAATAGVSLPTAPTARRADGSALPRELQPGSGSVDPSLGVAGTLDDYPLSLTGSAWLTAPTGDAGLSARLSVAAQAQLAPALALRVAVDGRVDGKSTEHGVTERDSGGAIAFIGADVVISPATDLVLTIGGRAPVWNALAGWHDEGVVMFVGVAYDID
ncbi:MAG: transporter [Myxococcales bacterium]|nr:transporter [Myxococcales bacterium]